MRSHGKMALGTGALVVAWALAHGTSRGDTNTHGIPGECTMRVVSCTVPGMGGVEPGTKATVAEVATRELVIGKWTYRACSVAPDRGALIVHRDDGFDLVREGKARHFEIDLMHYNPRVFEWHPDSRRVLLWGELDDDDRTPQGPPRHRDEWVQLMDVRDPAREQWKVAYDPATHHKTEGRDKDVVDPNPFGFEWSPDGAAFFVIERLYYRNAPGRYDTAIQRVELARLNAPKEIVRTSGPIDFVTTPRSRYVHGQGPSRSPYRLLFGHPEGLFAIDPRPGAEARRLSSTPATDLHNLDWNPNPAAPEQVLLYFKRAAAGANGEVFAGVMLLHLDRIGREELGPWREQLYDKTDVHTVWFSPGGEWASWGTKSLVGYRRPLDTEEKTVTVTCKTQDGEPLEVKGFAWHADERHLAITAGRSLFLHDAQDGTTTRIARFGDEGEAGFVADPHWVGDQVLLTRIDDMTTR